MKKSVLGFLAFLLIAAIATAQDFKSALSDAQQALNKFHLDPNEYKSELKNAVAAIDRALDTSEAQANFEVWNIKGRIYNEIATQLIIIRQQGIGDASVLPPVEQAALEAFNAFQKSRSLAQNELEVRDALQGITISQTNLLNTGIFMYEDGHYERSYELLKAAIDAHEVLINDGQPSTISSVGDYNDHLYITGLAAFQANMLQVAKPYFQKLYDLKYDNPNIYEVIYQIKFAEEGSGAAYPYLEAGLERYPDDVSLLFADINHGFHNKQLDRMITKLESAIQKEPNNIELYTTTGSVHDHFYMASTTAGDLAKAQEHFEKALAYYEKGLNLDGNNFDATYSIASLYFNRAARMSQQLNELAGDFSKEGIRKYEALKAEMFQQFEMALPYFQRSETLNPNDVNTLIALKEIYAHKDYMELSDNFKKRYETVQGGGNVEGSFFRSNQE